MARTLAFLLVVAIVAPIATSQNGGESFTAADAGSSATYPLNVGRVKVGHVIAIQDRPCTVTRLDSEQDRINIIGKDFFSGAACQETVPNDQNVRGVNIVKTAYEVIHIEGDEISLQDDDGELRQDLALPTGDIGDQLQYEFEIGSEIRVIVAYAMGVEQIVSYKAS